jgi:hypothetical protein
VRMGDVVLDRRFDSSEFWSVGRGGVLCLMWVESNPRPITTPPLLAD